MFKIVSNKSLVKPKAIVFDTDNTLYPYAPAHRAATDKVIDKAVDAIGLDRRVIVDNFDKARHQIKNQLGKTASSHSRLLYFQRAVECLGLGSKIFLTLDLEQTYWRTFLSYTKLFPGVEDFLKIIKKDGIIVANVTDLTAQIQFRKIIYFGLEDYFDYIVTSEEAGSDKPSPEPFDLILNKINMDSADVWVIGDNPVADIDGGSEAGMYTIQMTHSGSSTSGNADAIYDDYASLAKVYNDL